MHVRGNGQWAMLCHAELSQKYPLRSFDTIKVEASGRASKPMSRDCQKRVFFLWIKHGNDGCCCCYSNLFRSAVQDIVVGRSVGRWFESICFRLNHWHWEAKIICTRRAQCVVRSKLIERWPLSGESGKMSLHPRAAKAEQQQAEL